MISLLKLINEGHVPPLKFYIGRLSVNGSDYCWTTSKTVAAYRDKTRHKSQYYILNKYIYLSFKSFLQIDWLTSPRFFLIFTMFARSYQPCLSAMIRYFSLTTKQHQPTYKPQKRSSEQSDYYYDMKTCLLERPISSWVFLWLDA